MEDKDKECRIDHCQCCYDECNVCEIIRSIAMQEAGLAHILNAEGEKIHKAVVDNYSVQEILCVNKRVSEVVSEVTKLEIVLTDKLKSVLNFICCDEPCGCSGEVKISAICEDSCKAIEGVKVSIFDKEDCLIIVDYTDCKGKFSACLDCGVYKICLKYKEFEVFKHICVDCDHRNIYIFEKFCCEPIRPPHPEHHFADITGRVYDTCGRTLCGAKIFIEGNNCPVAVTNQSGYYELQVRACKFIRIYAECDGRRSPSTLIYFDKEKCYNANLTINMLR